MFLRSLRAAFIWAVIILVITLMPGDNVPDIGLFERFHLDKAVHAFLFAVFIVLLAKGFRLQTAFPDLQRHALLSAFTIAVFYGGMTEFLQEVLDLGRMGDLSDLLADIAGAIIGAVYVRWGEAKVARAIERIGS